MPAIDQNRSRASEGHFRRRATVPFSSTAPINININTQAVSLLKSLNKTMRNLLHDPRPSARHPRPNPLYVPSTHTLISLAYTSLTRPSKRFPPLQSQHPRRRASPRPQCACPRSFDVVLHGGVPRLRAALVSRGGMLYGPRGKYRLAEKVFWQGPETTGVGAALEGLLSRMARGISV